MSLGRTPEPKKASKIIPLLPSAWANTPPPPMLVCEGELQTSGATPAPLGSHGERQPRNAKPLGGQGRSRIQNGVGSKLRKKERN